MSHSSAVLIGLGRQGKSHYYALKELLSQGLLKKIYISDEDPNALEAIGEYKAKNIEYVGEAKSMSIDSSFFIIATPNSTHLDIISTLSKGSLVLKEKPLALNDLTYEQLNKVISDKNLRIYTAQQRYFNYAYLAAKDAIKDLGLIKFIEYRYTMNDTEESWYWSKEQGGGCTLNVGWHFFFILNWFFPGTYQPSDISIRNYAFSARSVATNIPDTVFLEMDTNGTLCKAYLSVSECKKQDAFRIIGSEGALEVNKSECTLYDKTGKIRAVVKGDEHASYAEQIAALLKGSPLTELNEINSKTHSMLMKLLA